MQPAAEVASALVPAWTWAVPIIVGLISVPGAIASVIISHINAGKQIRSAHALKICEMRQSWINDLRASMAEFQSYGVTPSLEHVSSREFYEKGTKIELLMNPRDPDYEALHNCLYAIFEADIVVERYAANPRYITVCQSILKREWEVLKKDARQSAGFKQKVHGLLYRRPARD